MERNHPSEFNCLYFIGVPPLILRLEDHCFSVGAPGLTWKHGSFANNGFREFLHPLHLHDPYESGNGPLCCILPVAMPNPAWMVE